MKPINQILFAIAIICFCSCNQRVDNNNNGSSGKNLSSEDSLRKAEFQTAIKDDPNHIIYDTTAFKYILAFCKMYPNIANSEFAGTTIKGNFDGAYVNKGTNHQGLVSYFCYDPSETIDKFFAAYKDTNSLTEEGTVYPPIDSHYFYLSRNCFTIPIASQTDIHTIQRFINSQPEVLSNPSGPVKASTFVNKCGKFITKFGATTVYKPLALAHHNQMRQLLGQPGCVGVRIFLGYDSIPTQKNKIRMLMFAVDSSGHNITLLPDGKKAIMLERMWP